MHWHGCSCLSNHGDPFQIARVATKDFKSWKQVKISPLHPTLSTSSIFPPPLPCPPVPPSPTCYCCDVWLTQGGQQGRSRAAAALLQPGCTEPGSVGRWWQQWLVPNPSPLLFPDNSGAGAGRGNSSLHHFSLQCWLEQGRSTWDSSSSGR